MELRVNDYVRTKKEISKIVSNPEDHNFNIDIFKKDRTTLRCIRKKDVIKSSPNIIDLIEVGDYVNGNKIIEISNDIYGNKILIYGYDNGKNQVAIVIYENEIETIVTKEQFKSIEYEVK